jgi:alpha/beta superfamily hydrolase
MPSPAPAESITVESVCIAAGDIELTGELAYPESLPSGTVAIAGPHPLMGGSMRNNVVRALGDGLAGRGFVTLRFDYRDGGDDPAQLAAFWKTSRADVEAEWAQDLGAAIAFLRSVVPAGLPRALVGYSFGCTLLAGVAGPGESLVLIAPTVGQHDFSAFEPLANPKLIIAPADDFAADGDETVRWLDRLSHPKCVERPRRDGHFFRGHEDWLVETVAAFLDDAWGGRP